MIKKVGQYLQHKRNVRSWEKEIVKKVNRLAKSYGYKKDSYDYQMLLNRIANNE